MRLHAIRGAARRIKNRPLKSMLAASAVFVVVLLFTIVFVAKLNLSAATARFAGGFDMVVYLDEGVTESRGQELGATLSELPAVKRVSYVSPAEAKGRLESELGPSFSGVEASALPSSLEVTLIGGVRDVANAHPLVDRLKATRGVAEVELLGEWVDKLSGVEKDAERGAYILLLLVSLVTVVVIFAVSGHGGRYSTLPALFGAKSSYTRGPRLLYGGLVAALGACSALLALRLLFPWGRKLTQHLYEGTGLVEDVAFLSLGQMLLVVAGVVALGTFGSALSIRRGYPVF